MKMGLESIQHENMPRKMIFIGIGLGFMIWLADVFSDAFLYKRGPFIAQLLASPYFEILELLFTSFILVGFGAYSSLIMRKLSASEKGLRESEKRYRSLIQTAEDIIFTLSLEGKFTTLNQAFETITGFSRAEYLGRHFQAIIHPEDLSLALDTFERLVAGHTPPPYELRILSKSGEYLTGEMISTPLIQGGKILEIMSIARDITARKRMEKSCQESEAKYRDLFESANDLIMSVIPDGTFQYVNRTWRETLGYTEEEVARLTLLDIIHPDSRINCLEAFQRIVAGEKIDHIGATFVAKDGRPILVEGSINCSTVAGRPTATRAIFRNITESRRSEEFIKNVLETVDEGFIVISPDFRIISVNTAYCSKLKLPLHDIIGRHCYEISHHVSLPCYESGEDCAVRGTFETGEPHTSVHTHFDKEGNPIYAEVKSFPLKDSQGKIISAIEIHNDITEKKKLEEKLRHAQKMEAIGTLAGGVAHDFNNILTAIIGYSSLMQMKMDQNDPLRPSVDSILASTERATNLTQSLLAFSRKQTIAAKHVDMNTIMRRVKKLIERLIGEDIEITQVLRGEPLLIKADAGQIEQILINLATNARDAMPRGGKLTFETGVVELGNEYVKEHGYGKLGKYAQLAVTDTGTGMDKKTVERIFEPFFTTKSTGKGTGLGLAIVYGIVKQHNGYIDVYSEPEIGTTFKIYLPLSRVAAEQATPVKNSVPKGGAETLLIAEDDTSVRNLMKSMLQGFGYTVIEASDGEEAIQKYRGNKDPIQLLILDVIMPRKNGRETYDEIRKTNPAVKALFTSGYTAEIIHKKGILENGEKFLAKPVSPNELLSKIKELMDSDAKECVKAAP
jgi:two-component system cell cycle sensor histidine kinase/response regulator CckA